MMQIGIFGNGSWATALAKVLSENKISREEKINWFFRKREDIDFMEKFRHHPRYLSAIQFDTDKFHFFSDIHRFFSHTSLVILAVPSAFVHQQLQNVPPEVFKNKKFFSAIKGIVPEHLLIMREYLHSVFGVSYEQIGVLTGPCHAEEIAMEKLSYLTVASENKLLRDFMTERLQCRYLNTIPSDDIFGTELAAVLKNVYAIACGIAMGMGYGDNFIAVLVSYALQEMKMFIECVHPLRRDFLTSAYVGDLLVTVYSQFSRNRMFGIMIGKGYSVHLAKMEMNMVAEGYYACACIHKISKSKGISLPLIDYTHQVLYEKKCPRKSFENLLSILN